MTLLIGESLLVGGDQFTGPCFTAFVDSEVDNDESGDGSSGGGSGELE